MRAQPAHIRELAPERPAAPLATAMPVGDGVSTVAVVEATEARPLEDQHVVGAVVAVDRGHDPGRANVLDVNGTGGLEPHRLTAHVHPGGGADALIGLHQVHVLGEPGVQPLVHDLADAVDVGIGVVAELGDRVVVVVDRRGQVDVAVAETGGPVRAVLDQVAPTFARTHVFDVGAVVAASTAAEQSAGHRGGYRAQHRRQHGQGRVGLVHAGGLDQIAPARTWADRVDGFADLVVDVVDGVADSLALSRADGGVDIVNAEQVVEVLAHLGVTN